MMIRRRTLLKAAATAVGASIFGRRGFLYAAESLPYSPTLPATPFDAPPGTWTLAVLPDTQYYSERFPDVFGRQTQWLVAHREAHHILFVAHEGDLVNHPEDRKQWEAARRALSILNEAKFPYAILPGNHDLGSGGGQSNNRDTLLNSYFTPDDYKHSAEVGFFEKGRMENSWHRIPTPAGDRLLFALEFGPRDAVLAWADGVAEAHAGQKTIVVTHAYVNDDGLRFDWEKYGKKQAANPKSYPFAQIGSVNDGQGIWDKFVSKHQQIQFVLNGHVCGSGLGDLTSTYPPGGTVRQLLANYQDNSPRVPGTVFPARGYGGGGFMRLLQFLPGEKTVRVKTYSPWYDRWLTEPTQQFDVSV